MAQHNVPATPQTFEIWFRYAGGTTPELNRIINIVVGNKRPLDDVTSRTLFVSYIGTEAEWDAQGAQTPTQSGDLIATAREYLAASPAVEPEANGVAAPTAGNARGDAKGIEIINDLVGELGKLATRSAALEARFAASLAELDNYRSTLALAEERSKTDALTGLANRHALDEFLRTSQMAAMESGQPLSIFLVDVDHFKRFNDTFGHQFGDQVLRLIAQVLKGSLRGDDLAARFGGEELVAVLPSADLSVGAAAAERVRASIASRQIRRRASGEVLASVTVSVGVAQFLPGETLANLFERCDRALYAAKRGGRNRTVTEVDLANDSAAA